MLLIRHAEVMHGLTCPSAHSRRERGRTQKRLAPHHEAGCFALRVPQRCGRFEGCTRASAIRCSSSSVSR
jgi:hypothetical protein